MVSRFDRVDSALFGIFLFTGSKWLYLMMAHFPRLRSLSMLPAAIALLSASGLTSLRPAAAITVDLSPRRAQLESPEFVPPQPVGAPRRRELAGTRFVPPSDLGMPERREPAGTRGSGCARLLLPTFPSEESTALISAYGYGKTTSDRPKLYLYIDSQSEEVHIRVSLFEAGATEPIAVMKQRYQGQPGLYEVDLFAAGAEDISFQSGSTYMIRSEVACADSVTQDWSYSVEHGVIQRVESEEGALGQDASALQRVNFAAEEGLWVDLMAQVADIARDRPNDPELITTWLTILDKLQADFAQTTTAGEESITQKFFEGLQDRALVVVEPEDS